MDGELGVCWFWLLVVYNYVLVVWSVWLGIYWNNLIGECNGFLLFVIVLWGNEVGSIGWSLFWGIIFYVLCLVF